MSRSLKKSIGGFLVAPAVAFGMLSVMAAVKSLSPAEATKPEPVQIQAPAPVPAPDIVTEVPSAPSAEATQKAAIEEEVQQTIYDQCREWLPSTCCKVYGYGC